MQNLRDQLIMDGLITKPAYIALLEELDHLRESLQEDSKLTNPTLVTNVIDRNGLASYLIQFYQSGQSIDAIANALTTLNGETIKPQQMEDWLNTYKQTNSLYVKPDNKLGSVFDASARYQDLYEQLSTLLDDIKTTHADAYKNKNVTKEQILIDLFKEMRMLTAQADQFVSTQTRAQALRSLIADMVNAIASYNPIVGRDIINLIKVKSSLWDTLLLGGSAMNPPQLPATYTYLEENEE